MSSEIREWEELPRAVLPAIPSGFNAMKAFSRTGSDLLIQHMGPTFTTLVERSDQATLIIEPAVEVLGFRLNEGFLTSELSAKANNKQKKDGLVQIDASLARFHQALTSLPSLDDSVLDMSGNANIFFYLVDGVMRTVSGRWFGGWKLAHLNGGFVTPSDNDIKWALGDRFFIFKRLGWWFEGIARKKGESRHAERAGPYYL
jgi:hypothetical protein